MKKDKLKYIASIISFIMYILCVAGDIRLLVRWNSYGEIQSALALFVPLMLLHMVFVILGIVWIRQWKRMQESSAEAEGRTKKGVGRFVLLAILGIVAVYSHMTADTMVSYIYQSRNGHYEEMERENFKTEATMLVTSEDLAAGSENRWDETITNTDQGQNLSPQITFDSVPGASYYVIYMVDESANNWVHWYASGITQTSLDHGANVGDYIGPYPPEGSGDHIYTIYVFALAGDLDPHTGSDLIPFDEPGVDPVNLHDTLNIKDSGRKPYLYGNVLAFGYLTGVYSR